MTTGLRAGAAIADVTPKNPVRMDGYGGRLETSRGVHDPLFARVLALEDGAGSRVAVVVCDLLGVHPDVTTEVRRLSSDRFGIPPEAVLVLRHPQSRRPGGLRSGMFSRLGQELAEMVTAKVAGALDEACRSLRPATLKLGGTVVDSISMNRRDAEGPIDPVLRVLLIHGEDGPIASVLNFACHATALSGQNLVLSAEFPGAQLTRYQNERWAATWARRQADQSARRTEMQALSLGEGLAILALPASSSSRPLMRSAPAVVSKTSCWPATPTTTSATSFQRRHMRKAATRPASHSALKKRRV